MSEELIDEELNKENIVYNEAENSTRFGNYIIDMIVVFVIAMGLGYVFAIFEIDFVIMSLDMPVDIVGYFIGFIYYTLMESQTGKTIGKYITKTRVIDEEGDHISFKTAAIRSLCRMIPFDALSFLFADRGWHDSISKTYVIKEDS